MLNKNNKIENLFERLGHILFQNPLKVLFFLFAIITILGFQLAKLTVDASSEAVLHKDDQFLLEYNAFQDQFGRDEIIIIAIKAPSIFNTEFLEKLKSFHRDLEKKVPYIEKVSSLINARNVRGIDDALVIGELLEDWPKNHIDLNLMQKYVLNNPLYKNYFISENGKLTSVLIETKALITENKDKFNSTGSVKSTNKHYFSENERKKVIDALHSVMDLYRADDFEMFLAGGPIIIHAFNSKAMDDMIFVSGLAVFVIVIILSLFFRRVSGVILPVIIVLSAVISTLGIMAFIDAPLTMVTNIIAGLLIAVGIADAVHILAIFYKHYQQSHDKEDAISYALGHSGLAIVLTSLTTAAGFLSFSIAELSSIADLGIYATCGVMLALIYTIFLIPPMVALIPIKLKAGDQKRSVIMDRVLLSFASFSSKHSWKIVCAGIAISIASVIFICMLRFSHNTLSGFPDGAVIKKDVTCIDEEFKGITALEVVVDTKLENGIQDPIVLRGINDISKTLEQNIVAGVFVGKVFSINDVIKEINQALHGNDPNFYTIPEDKAAIAQELFLFETTGADELEKMVDFERSKARITIKTPFVDSVEYKNFMRDIETRFQDVFTDKVEITLTGGMALMARAIPKALRSMARSYVMAVIVISIMMILLVRNVRIGMISMGPNILPILLVMGIMGYSGVPLDMTTILIGSIAIGLVVDDTVHFIYNFQKYHNITGDVTNAIQESFLGTGRALLITSVILCANFFCNLGASLANFHRFGILCGLTIIFALLADFVLTPALLILIVGKGKSLFFK